MSQYNPECIAEMGWRQGCILSVDMVKQLQEDEKIRLLKDISDSDLLIVVSHDCDIANSSFDAEPYVEIVLARNITVDKKNGSLFWGRNPRRFQFLTQSEELLYEISIHDRFFINRNLLLCNKPGTQQILLKDVVRQISLWISKRYFRAAFPDNFNNRINKKAQEAIRNRLKKDSEEITAIYISVSDDELESDEVYQIIIRATMQLEAYKNTDLHRKSQETIDIISAKLSQCEGIDVIESYVVSEAEVTVDDLRLLKRWDYDYLSYSADTPDEIAPYH